MIERASRRIINKLHCPATLIEASLRDGLAEVLHEAPCSVSELNLSECTGLDGFDLNQLLLPPAGGALACSHLRILKLGGTRLSGEIPKALGKCLWLQILELHDNWLRGPIPEAICTCANLETLMLHGNALQGLVPATALARLGSLHMLTLGGDEVGGNDELTISSSGASLIQRALAEDAEIYFPRFNDESSSSSPSPGPAGGAGEAGAPAHSSGPPDAKTSAGPSS